jgi:hypothetical protein
MLPILRPSGPPGQAGVDSLLLQSRGRAEGVFGHTFVEDEGMPTGRE